MEKKQLKILIVEDDFVLAENLKENLYSMGYGEVFHAKNSDEGIQLFNHIEPDLCLVDIQLDKSPLDGIQMVSSVHMGTKVPVIYLSSFVDCETRERAKGTHPAGYLVKPATNVQIDIALDLALDKAETNMSIVQHCSRLDNEIIFMKAKTEDYERYEKYNQNEFCFFKAEGSYTKVYLKDKMSLLSTNLKKTLTNLSSTNIIRCHRSYAINLQHIHSFDNDSFYLMREKEVVVVPIGEEYREEVNVRIKKI